ncbi:fumarate hydratase [Caloranaerobacter ferrireducens]|uniref:fumarate hydratase n=1 Tax=Caloranaerobacter ferrireducens TaxID=1323370 RepID=UPI00084E000C|nr:fumarate hydratase [Caloranaerobacter ferrireducens]
MRKINVSEIIDKVKEMCIKANYELGEDVLKKLQDAKDKEQSHIGKDILDKLILNANISKEKQMPMCQDTGMAVFFVEVGQDIYIEGGNLTEAINEGVRQGYKEGFLRKSVVNDPIIRKNTMDNTPAIIHYDLVDGDRLKISFTPKGFGSENMSGLKMLKPSDGIEGIKKFVLDVVKNAGANPCPPIVVGVGIGGTMEKACILAKKALFRKIGEYSSIKHIKKLEKELLDEINKTGIGPQGLGGDVTALSVNIEVFPTHIAGLPVAVNINCHAARHIEIEL